ncbi:helix-turn-helix transcriptional regulator [Dactylosporangium sp. NPDC000555]|uniref:helix-turn-helix domain-containing protein n=1 Tax=Dactylosporangium sp. NPDC000555 TaxID=3154260 RepID=UPI0033295748
MLQQPEFGRRLRQLRMERGKSQAELVGLGMSAAYLSRLESGSREPTARAVEYLAEALGVAVEAFEDLAGPNLADVLGMVFTSSDATRAAEARDLLTAALDGTPGADATTRWLALSELARLYSVLGEHERERDMLV